MMGRIDLACGGALAPFVPAPADQTALWLLHQAADLRQASADYRQDCRFRVCYGPKTLADWEREHLRSMAAVRLARRSPMTVHWSA